MANANSPFGFRPMMRTMAGGPGAAAMGAHKLVGDGTALFIGDAVKLAASAVRDTQCITAAGATDLIAGVNLIYGAASTLTDHVIVPATADNIFLTQIDTAAQANVSYNAALVAGAGLTGTFISQHSANGVATTSTLNLRLVGLFRSPDNAWGAYARVEVIFNKLQRKDQLAGV